MTAGAQVFEGGPPEPAGGPHERTGDGAPRWMAAERDAARRPGTEPGLQADSSPAPGSLTVHPPCGRRWPGTPHPDTGHRWTAGVASLIAVLSTLSVVPLTAAVLRWRPLTDLDRRLAALDAELDLAR